MTHHRRNVKSVCGIVLVVLASLFVLDGAMMCWIMRDGMGPDSIESHGMTALLRFFKEFWIAPAVALPVVIFGLWLARSPKKPIPPTTVNSGQLPLPSIPDLKRRPG